MVVKSSGEVLKIQAGIDALDVKINDLLGRVSEMEMVFDKVQRIRNVPATISEFHKRLDNLEKDWKWIFKNVGKAETEVSDLKGKVLGIERMRERFEGNEESMHELMKVLDDIDSKLEGAATEKSVDEVAEGLLERIGEVKKEHEARLDQINGVVEDVQDTLRRSSGLDRSEIDKRMFVSRKEFDDLRREIEILRGSAKSSLGRRFEELAHEAERHVQAGRLNAARMVYGDALEVFNRIASGGGDASVYLERMNDLYNTLKD